MSKEHGPIATHTASSTAEMAAVVAHLATQSCWFQVTPMPDDLYEIDVKQDRARDAFPKMNEYTVLVLRPDYASQNYGQDTFLSHVTAPTVAAAQRLARIEACNADGNDAPEDYHIQLVVEGHHHDIQVDDAT